MQESDLRRLYLDEHKTDVEIAAILRCHKQTVWNNRRRFGIESFKRWERHICEPSERQLQIIYGSLLGDASISNGKKGDYECESVFEVKHCAKQKDYLFWKYEELKNLSSSEPKETNNGQWRFRTFHHPFFSCLRRKWYPAGIKLISQDHLNLINLLGIAVWFMDDGSLSKASNFIKFHTCAFSDSEHNALSFWFENKFGISSHMKIYSGYRNLVIDLDSRKQFVKIIKPYVIPSMMYKVTFREYHTWEN